jgi:hypothetical protein
MRKKCLLIPSLNQVEEENSQKNPSKHKRLFLNTIQNNKRKSFPEFHFILEAWQS